MASSHALLLWELEEVSPLHVQFAFNADAFSVTAPKSLDSFYCVEYSIDFGPSRAECAIRFQCDHTQYDVFSYAVKNYLASVKVATLRKVAKTLGIKLATSTPHIEIAQQLIDHACGLLDDDTKSSSLEALRTLIAKRARKRKKSNAGDDETAGTKNDGDDSSDASDADDMERQEELKARGRPDCPDSSGVAHAEPKQQRIGNKSPFHCPLQHTPAAPPQVTAAAPCWKFRPPRAGKALESSMHRRPVPTLL